MNKLLLILILTGITNLFAQKLIKSDVSFFGTHPETKFNYLIEINPLKITFLDFKLVNTFITQNIERLFLYVKELKNVTINDVNNYICAETTEELFEIVLVSKSKNPNSFKLKGDRITIKQEIITLI